MNDERVMICCCSDGTRPVIFKIERLDYLAIYIENVKCDGCREKIKEALLKAGADEVSFKEKYAEVYVSRNFDEKRAKDAIESLGSYKVSKID